MLPTLPSRGRRLAEIMPDSLAAMRGTSPELSRVRSAIVVLVDGLGAVSLRGRAGHARHLAARMTRNRVIDTCFPTTTASAITSLTTGVGPLVHGFVGWEVNDIANERALRLIDGWDARANPDEWQREPTVFETARSLGFRAIAIGPKHYANSGFSRAVLRGADYVLADRIEERLLLAVDAAERAATLVYVYIPELDKLAHRHGIADAKWLDALEALDGAVEAALATLPQRVGAILTADHGMVDIQHRSHRMLHADLLRGVSRTTGEPRAVQLRLESDVDPASVAERFATELGDAAWVTTTDDAIRAGLFGTEPPGDAALDRLGQVLLIAKARTAFYTDPDSRGRSMIGQHGAISDDERLVPELRFGAWS